MRSPERFVNFIAAILLAFFFILIVKYGFDQLNLRTDENRKVLEDSVGKDVWIGDKKFEVLPIPKGPVKFGVAVEIDKNDIREQLRFRSNTNLPEKDFLFKMGSGEKPHVLVSGRFEFAEQARCAYFYAKYLGTDTWIEGKKFSWSKRCPCLDADRCECPKAKKCQCTKKE